MKEINLEEAKTILAPVEGIDRISDDELTEQLSANITFQIAFDDGNVLPIFKMPFCAMLEMWQAVGLKDSEKEYTSEDAAEIGRRFKDLIDDGTVDYDI